MSETWVDKPTYCGKWCIKHKSDDGPQGLVYDAEIRWNEGPEVKIYMDDEARWHAVLWVLLNGWSKWSPISKPPANALAYFEVANPLDTPSQVG